MHSVKYPIGIQSFAEIRKGDYLYIDKTAYIRRLVNTGKYYFLSRPRRFGKSLLMSTVEALFQGRKELFAGLEIASDPDWDWLAYPVLHLDFTGANYQSAASLESHLDAQLSIWEQQYGCRSSGATVENRFKNVIRQALAMTGRNVVILVDEYDKPLLDAVDDLPLQESFRRTLKGFYGCLKSMDAQIRFAMLTGVTRMGKLSIFSDLNNLSDISMVAEFDGICGITDEELTANMEPGIEALATALGVSGDEAYQRLKFNYDGYHFCTPSRDIYNPFSLLSALRYSMLDSFWYRTGTPTFLIRMIKAGGMELDKLEHYVIGVDALSDGSFDLSNPIPILYQAGYLTIKQFSEEFRTMALDFPNAEVKRGFLQQLLPFYTAVSREDSAFEIQRFVEELRSGRVDDFMERLCSLFADISYEGIDLGNLERHYQNVIYLIVKLMGFYWQIEYRTSHGRIDLMVRARDYLYIFEFKVDSSAREALDQINRKRYAAPFMAEPVSVVKIGVNFSSKQRGIESWIVERD